MRLRHTLLAAALAGSPLLIAVPAHAADHDHTITIDGFDSIVPGGDWSTGTITVKNGSSTEYNTQHLMAYFGMRGFLPDQMEIQYANGPEDSSWHPTELHRIDGSIPQMWDQGVSVDFKGAPLDIGAGLSYILPVRVRLIQSTHEEPSVGQFYVKAFLGSGLGTDSQAYDATVFSQWKPVRLSGLTAAMTGLPKQIPADGVAHPFQISIKSQNHFDWHIDRTKFFLWAGTWEGPSACDAEIDVQDPADGSWHKVTMNAAFHEGEDDVDLVKWATGPVDNRVLNARISLGKNFKSTVDDTSLGFGFRAGGGAPTLLWANESFSAVAVAGAPDCVHPDGIPASDPGTGTGTGATGTGSGTTSPSPAPSSSPAAGMEDETTTPTAGGGERLASTGSSGTGLVVGAGAALIALGAGAIALARRIRRSS